METEIDFWWNNLNFMQQEFFTCQINKDPEYLAMKVAKQTSLQRYAYEHQILYVNHPDFPPTIYRKV
jgi:hypothetical protein